MLQKKKIILKLTNSQSFNAQVSLFGGLSDPLSNTVNTHKLFAWNITGQTYTGLTVFQIEYRKVGAAVYSVASMPIPSNFYDVILSLNLLGLGAFWFSSLTGPTYNIYTGSDTYEFRQLSIA